MGRPGCAPKDLAIGGPTRGAVIEVFRKRVCELVLLRGSACWMGAEPALVKSCSK